MSASVPLASLTHKTNHFLLTAVMLFTMLPVSLSYAQRTSRVSINSTPAGAAVYLDSTSTAPVGTTPMRRVRLPRGNHTLIFKLDRYEETKLPVNFRRWREQVQVTLKPLAKLDVSAGNEEAQNATVRINGKELGTIPFQKELQPILLHIHFLEQLPSPH